MVGNKALSLSKGYTDKHGYLEKTDCTHYSNRVVEDEFIFLTECNEYKNISETYFSGTEHIYSVFTKENKEGKLSLLCETMHTPNHGMSHHQPCVTTLW